MNDADGKLRREAAWVMGKGTNLLELNTYGLESRVCHLPVKGPGKSLPGSGFQGGRRKRVGTYAFSPVPTHVSSIPTGREELHGKPPPSWEGPGWQEGLLCPVDTCSSLPATAGTGIVPRRFHRTAYAQVPGLSSVSDAIRCRLAILQSWVRLLRAETRGRSGMMVRRVMADTGIPKGGSLTQGR